MLDYAKLPKEKFEDYSRKLPKYFISIGRDDKDNEESAYIYRFNGSVVSKYGINEENYTHCELFFNEARQVIFFKFVKIPHSEKPAAYHFKITKDGNIRKIQAQRFAVKHKITHKSYADKYPCHEVNVSKNNLELCIDLNEKGKVK